MAGLSFFNIAGNLTALRGAIFQALQSCLHLADPSPQSFGQGFISDGRADNGCDNLMQIGMTFDGVGQGLFVGTGFGSHQAVAKRQVGGG